MATELPKDFEKTARQKFSKLEKPEVSFERFLEAEGRALQRQQQLQGAPALGYKPGLPTMRPCGNGDFDKGLDPLEWQGAFADGSGTLPLSPTNPFAGFAAGLSTDPDITHAASHQTWVSNSPAATDPNVGIPLAAQGSSGAIRIGNQINGWGCELLSKTFVVTPAQSLIKFWYAVVLENPKGHDASIQPFFCVRVTDTATDTVIPGAVNLGIGGDKVIADATNPFFQTRPPVPPSDATIVYKDWTCAQINLSTQIGKKVTIEFVSADCGAGGHFGYAYIDNFCGTCEGSPEGTVTFDEVGSSSCGMGSLCFDYTLPQLVTKTQTVTGSVTITLDIYQNGNLLATLSSPTLTSGTNYCFPLDPLSIPGIDPALGGLDYVATGNFTIPNASGSGTVTLPPMTVGAAPDGRVPGANNDYPLQCKFFSYAVKFVCGGGTYATEINIYNQTSKDVTVRKRIVPVVLAGAPTGREPRVAFSKAEDKITLPPNTATMDDCCRIAELVCGAWPQQGPMPLTIGFLEIVSPVDINVTAVYTAGAGGGSAVSIDVEQIQPKVILI